MLSLRQIFTDFLRVNFRHFISALVGVLITRGVIDRDSISASSIAIIAGAMAIYFVNVLISVVQRLRRRYEFLFAIVSPPESSPQAVRDVARERLKSDLPGALSVLLPSRPNPTDGDPNK